MYIYIYIYVYIAWVNPKSPVGPARGREGTFFVGDISGGKAPRPKTGQNKGGNTSL